MDEFDLCRMGDIFSLTTAAALICGIEPSRVHDKNQFGDEGFCVWHRSGNDPSTDHDDAPRLFRTALENLVRAVEAGALSAKIVYPAKQRYVREGDRIDEPRFVPAGPLDPVQTTVTLYQLRNWLGSKGITNGFFFPDAKTDPLDFLDPNNPKSPPELRVAVDAWHAVTAQGDPRENGKGVSVTVLDWITENKTELELRHGIQLGVKTIRRIASVVNWHKSGGAARTPGH